MVAMKSAFTQRALLPLLIVAAIGSVGSWAYLYRSSASTVGTVGTTNPALLACKVIIPSKASQQGEATIQLVITNNGKAPFAGSGYKTALRVNFNGTTTDFVDKSWPVIRLQPGQKQTLTYRAPLGTIRGLKSVDLFAELKKGTKTYDVPEWTCNTGTHNITVTR